MSMEETVTACPTHGRDSIAETSSEDQYTFRCLLCEYKYTAYVTRNGDEINYHGQANFTIHSQPVNNYEPLKGVLKYKVKNIPPRPDSSVESC
jgi:hypothetical protein